MSLCDASLSQLILVDLQARLIPVIHEGQSIVNNARILGDAATLLEVPVLGTEQNPEGLGPNVAEIGSLCGTTVAKSDFDCCAEAAFLDALVQGRSDLIVAGCEAHVCVLQTVLGLLSRSRKVRVVTDAIGSRSPHNKAAAMERMKAAGAELVTTEMVVFEWMRSSRHPRFKECLRLIK